MIYLASDHRGMIRKEEVKKLLDLLGREYQDVGNLMFDPNDDEVDFVAMAAEKMKEDIERAASARGYGEPMGIFFCGSGVMVDVAANRYPHVRACLAFDKKQVEMARHDDDVNVLCIGADFLDSGETEKLVRIFLEKKFSQEERFKRRIEKLSGLGKEVKR